MIIPVPDTIVYVDIVILKVLVEGGLTMLNFWITIAPPEIKSNDVTPVNIITLLLWLFDTEPL